MSFFPFSGGGRPSLRLSLLLPALLWTAFASAPFAAWARSSAAIPSPPAAVTVTDADGRRLSFPEAPVRAVSLTPSDTELIFAVGAGDAVAGVTFHDHWPPEAAAKPVVGGFLRPSAGQILALRPDAVFIAGPHRELARRLRANLPGCRFVRLPRKSLSDLYASIDLLGRIFRRPDGARRLSASIKSRLEGVAARLERVPASERIRVMRLMGRDSVMTPGADSFQNEIIRLAGGIPPDFGRNGALVNVTKAEWQEFNPQFLYGCGGDRQAADAFLNRDGWKEADAVKHHKIEFFPCDLTCRLSARTGDFVAGLASRLYGSQFFDNGPVTPDAVAARRRLNLDMPFVAFAEIVDASVFDAIHKTLVLHLRRPMRALSTLEGWREKIRFAGNSHSPPEVWGLYHRIGLDESRRRLMDVIGRDRADTTLLFTGVDMDNLSVQYQSFKDMTVAAVVTAGAKSNAVRMSRDEGRFYEPGTINMLIMSNMRLSKRAMSRAVISATEAKSAALQDMDIRSSCTPLINPATGTGTDNIIVLEGGPGNETDAGAPSALENAGGHSKLGELIARAVYAGVQESLFRQNGLTPNRPVFRRLSERGIHVSGLVSSCVCECAGGPARDCDGADLAGTLENLLLQPGFAGFLEAALAVSDAAERGLTSDLTAFGIWCGRMAEEAARAAGGEGATPADSLDVDFARPLPPALEMAFSALVRGAAGALGAAP